MKLFGHTDHALSRKVVVNLDSVTYVELADGNDVAFVAVHFDRDNVVQLHCENRHGAEILLREILGCAKKNPPSGESSGPNTIRSHT